MYQCENGTPLIAAIDGNKKETIRYFLEEVKCDVNRTDLLGNSPLYVATFKGNLELVKMLLEAGGDPWIKGPQKSTVLHICAERNFESIAKCIIEFDKDKNEALVFERTELDDEDVETGGGMTAMHVACEWNSIELVEYFFEIGGEKLVRIQNGEGQDAIDFSYAENMEAPYAFLNKKLGLPGRWILCNIF